MKKTAAAALALLGALLAGRSEALRPLRSAATPAARPRLVVGLDDNSPAHGSPVTRSPSWWALDIDMAKEAAKRLGLEVSSSPSTGAPRKPNYLGKRVTRCGTA